MQELPKDLRKTPIQKRKVEEQGQMEPEEQQGLPGLEQHPALRTRPPWHLETDAGRRLLCEQFGTRDLRAFGCEDLDLCARLQESGYEIWYLPEAELYHLEGQSYTPEEQKRVSFYNHWLHTQRWGTFLDTQFNAAAL